ncbi:RNA polymerase sigma-70 factor [Spirillospora sp. CA-294931]|uniref:RNA polymerase sigma-70 factor n=1 Tax=Spirillospora sp. CA-294931 TaxID=3240042 RepID=UPI003D8D42E7
MDDDADVVFQDYRNLLFSVAYRMLGSAADAEDVVQDAWLRWSVGDRSGVADPKAYLVRITTNLALDRLTSARAQRETYVGPWLPEPIMTSPDVADSAELSESVSMAMLVVLESLSPLERAVFVLKDVFGFPYAEIARAIDHSEVSVRQLGTRARKHVEARRPRFEHDREVRKAATDRFLEATLGGDINQLMEILAPDVTLWTDGGGKVRAALRPIYGADRLARWLAGVSGTAYAGVEPADMRFRRLALNGEPALVIDGPDGPIGTFTVDIDAEGRVAAVRAVANPDKLQALAKGTVLTM